MDGVCGPVWRSVKQLSYRFLYKIKDFLRTQECYEYPRTITTEWVEWDGTLVSLSTVKLLLP